jgi:hypothetical protein
LFSTTNAEFSTGAPTSPVIRRAPSNTRIADAVGAWLAPCDEQPTMMAALSTIDRPQLTSVAWLLLIARLNCNVRATGFAAFLFAATTVLTSAMGTSSGAAC